MVLPGSNREASDSDNSVEAVIIKSVEAVPAIVREKSKCRKTIGTAKMSSFKRAGKNKRGCSKRISDAMDDFKKFSESLVEELKADYQKMFEKMKEDPENLAAANCTLMTTKKKGKGIQNSGHAQEQRSTHSEPQHGEQHQNPSLSCNFITPAGQSATNTGFIHGRGNLTTTAVNLPTIAVQLATNTTNTRFIHGRGSMTTTAVNQPMIGQFPTNTGFIHERRGSLMTTTVTRPARYFTNLLRQVSNPGNLSYPYQNNIQTFGMGSAGFPLPIRRQRLGNASYIPNRTVANKSSGGGRIIHPRSSHALTYDSVPANRFRDINFNDNFEMNEAWLRMHGRRNGDTY